MWGQSGRYSASTSLLCIHVWVSKRGGSHSTCVLCLGSSANACALGSGRQPRNLRLLGTVPRKWRCSVAFHLLALPLLQCQLVTTKQAQNSATAAAPNIGTAGGSGTNTGGGSSMQLQQLSIQQQQQGGPSGPRGSSTGGVGQPGGSSSTPAGNAAQELRLHVPTIGARLDSRQFEVLVDVIQNIAMAPVPTVSMMEDLPVCSTVLGCCCRLRLLSAAFAAARHS